MKRTATTVGWSAAALVLATAMSGCSAGAKDAGPAFATTPAAPTATVAAEQRTATSGGGYLGGGSASPSAKPTKAATVSTKSVGKLGTVLVDGKGHTLYLFMKDTRNKSACTGACPAAWPPLLTSGKAKAAQKAMSGLLGTTKRSGGTQVTYNGHPVYTYAVDTKAGQAKGQGLNQFGALWFVLDPAGDRITTKP
ncbi:hypothetical protein ACFO3J_22585 [Streptomyces polygonati]|uniref:Lipoprotein with Yx(FWY)xxD motif n=1 Tax=Streptomyces polygonati TaxID=1617087 RepID=A0ABV8HTV2_9ACTN